MIIWRSCCFWLCSLITRDKLTWKHIRLVGLLRPPSLCKLPHPHPPTPPPTITPSFPAPPPMQATPLPSCIRPFSVTILYFDGSQRKKERDKETERLGLLWLSDMGPSFFFFPSISSSLPPCLPLLTSSNYLFYPSLTLPSSVFYFIFPSFCLEFLLIYCCPLSPHLTAFSPTPSPSRPTFTPPLLLPLQPLNIPPISLAPYCFTVGSL